MTYRTTPNRQVEGGVSPSEALFGRRIRTNLELLLPPPPKPPTEPSELNGGSQKRKFEPHDLVYAKLYSGNKWHWATGVVCDRVGRVMYTVWVEDRRLIRSHVNQLRSRADWDPGTDGAAKPKLPLDILLESWNLPEPSAGLDLSVQLGSLEPPSPTDVADGSPSLPPSVSEATSSTPRSLEQVSQSDCEPAPSVPVLRRSSRVRRQPDRFTLYQLN